MGKSEQAWLDPKELKLETKKLPLLPKKTTTTTTTNKKHIDKTTMVSLRTKIFAHFPHFRGSLRLRRLGLQDLHSSFANINLFLH